MGEGIFKPNLFEVLQNMGEGITFPPLVFI